MTNLNYWQRKQKAMKFGKPDQRPQDEDGMRQFLLHRRRKNFNCILQNNPNIDRIRNRLPPIPVQIAPTRFHKAINMSTHEGFIFVATPDEFDVMLDLLYDVDVFALDLEFNDDHSYLGMICLIQISTYYWDIFIDPFQLFEEIQCQLKIVLESEHWTKVMHGCANDVRNLQRDFGIYMVGVIDTQIMYQEYKSVGTGTVLKFDKLAALFFSTKDLSYLSANEKECLTLADYRQRPLPSKLCTYARADVHVLIRIYFEMRINMNIVAFTEAVRRTNELLIKPGLTYATAAEVNISTDPLVKNNKMYNSLTPRQKLTFGAIYQWRQDLAKRIDEKPEYVIKSADIINCIVNQTQPQEIEVLVGKYSESYNNQSVIFLKLVQNYEYYDQLLKSICHNCLTAGHCAWGCVEDYSKENQHRFYDANPGSKNVVNRHRRQNRDANRRARNSQQE